MMTRREKLRQQAVEEIKAIAWDLLRQNQPVTIQQITRTMGMTAPAFYTYFSSREALMADLVADALTSFYHTISAPFPGPFQDIALQIVTLFMRHRSWAVEHPNAFALFAGNPVFGFDTDQTSKTAKEIYRFILDQFMAADRKGRLKKIQEEALATEYAGQLAQIRGQICPEADISTIHHVVRMVSQVHGLISMELSNRFNLLITEREVFFKGQLLLALNEIGMTENKNPAASE